MGWFIISLGLILIGGGTLLGSLFGKKTEKHLFDYSSKDDRNSNITINNYTTEQHLHISEETARRLSKNE